MKRFTFRLARVRDFRRQQLELEEAKLQALIAERRSLETEASRLESETSETRRSLMVTSAAVAQDLIVADLYLRHLAAEKKRHDGKVADWRARVRKQEDAITEARRHVKLLDKLEAKQLREWQAGFDREQEHLSAELYLARWKKT